MHPPRTHLTIPVGAPMSEPGIIRETSTKAGHRVTLAIEYGWKVAFIHPEACCGVLTELVEVPNGDAE